MKFFIAYEELQSMICQKSGKSVKVHADNANDIVLLTAYSGAYPFTFR